MGSSLKEQDVQRHCHLGNGSAAGTQGSGGDRGEDVAGALKGRGRCSCVLEAGDTWGIGNGSYEVLHNHNTESGERGLGKVRGDRPPSREQGFLGSRRVAETH